MTPRLACTTIALFFAAASPCDGQSLAARVAATPDGWVRFAYAALPGVSGNGRNVIQWDCGRHHCRQQVNGNMSDVSDAEWRGACDSGPATIRESFRVRVELRLRRGAIVGMRVAVGGGWVGRPDVTDLGTVSAPEAAQYLLSQARRSDGDVGGRAIFAATLADSATVWPELLRIARTHRDPALRRRAIFWLGQSTDPRSLALFEELLTRP